MSKRTVERLKYLLIPAVLVFSHCSKERVQSIPEEFGPYVEAFFAEGQKRGFNTRLDEVDLIMEFGGLSDNNIAGQCSYRKNKVTIDEQKWNNMDEERRAWLIFHELGHCLLDRPHRNELTGNGVCISLMKGREGGFDCSLNYYSDKWWGYYLDELFDPGAPLPEWLQLYEEYDFFDVGANVLSIDTTAATLTIDTVDLSSLGDYSIDLEFDNWNSGENLVKFYFGNIGFSHCDICTGTNVRISSDTPQQVYFENPDGNISFGSDTKLSIRKIGSGLYFYVNERFVHTFEAGLMEGESIRTRLFDPPIRMKLEVYEME